MSVLEFMSSFLGFVTMFVFVIVIQSLVFLVVSRPKKAKKWHKMFYLSVEASQVSQVDPTFTWSFLRDPDRFMMLNYKNRFKGVKFDQPLKSSSEVNIMPMPVKGMMLI